ncbi:MAG: hypothetical protein OXI71_07765 [Gemmatimonadota bacterium]|nr:hypothetical protein [Gemmatimonadota bacterium]
MLAAATLVHGAFRLWHYDRGFDWGPEATAIGAPINEHIVALETGESLGSLSQFSRGQCVYVVVASSSCPFSRRAAEVWTAAAMATPEHELVPKTWAVLWVLVESGELAPEFLDSRFPVPRFLPEDNQSSMNGAGIRAFPYHIVLDTAGLVVQAGSGARLHDHSAFGLECRISSATGSS